MSAGEQVDQFLYSLTREQALEPDHAQNPRAEHDPARRIVQAEQACSPRAEAHHDPSSIKRGDPELDSSALTSNLAVPLRSLWPAGAAGAPASHDREDTHCESIQDVKTYSAALMPGSAASVLMSASHRASPLCSAVAQTERPATLPTGKRDEAFLEFLLQMEREGIVKLEAQRGSCAHEIRAWQVLDVDLWWRKVFEAFPAGATREEGGDAGGKGEHAFFMRLRRLGFRPMNKAPKPATSGYDFRLRRPDVLRHGYEFSSEVLYKYAGSSKHSK